MTRISFDIKCVQLISGGCYFSMIVKDMSVCAPGHDIEFRIGGNNRQIFKTITVINVCDEPISYKKCILVEKRFSDTKMQLECEYQLRLIKKLSQPSMAASME